MPNELNTPNDTPLLRSLQLQRRVVFALLMREILTRYGRHNVGFLWLFLEPMMFTVGVTLLWSYTKSAHGVDLPITVFALTGYSCVLLWRNMPGRTVGSVQPNLSLMFHRNVRILDIMLARVLLEAAGVTMSFVLLGMVFIGFEWMDMPEDVLTVAGGWLMLVWFGMALGLLMGALSERSELIDKFWHPFTYMLFPLSGAIFLVEALPPQAQEFILWLPMVHCVEMVRDGYFGSHFNAIYDMGYVAAFNMGLTVMALSQLRFISRTVVPG
ncbi:MAG: ABC transporter permease [Sphingobium sp.]